jgi:hypothetical protein
MGKMFRRYKSNELNNCLHKLSEKSSENSEYDSQKEWQKRLKRKHLSVLIKAMLSLQKNRKGYPKPIEETKKPVIVKMLRRLI